MPDAQARKVTHSYTVRYPAHEAREDDPHYKDFDHLRREWSKDPVKWRCWVGVQRDDFSECDSEHPLELHHAHLEFAMLNAAYLPWVQRRYPGITDPTKLGEWVESADNLVVLCQRHHRGHDGAHVASASDYEGILMVRGLIE